MQSQHLMPNFKRHPIWGRHLAIKLNYLQAEINALPMAAKHDHQVIEEIKKRLIECKATHQKIKRAKVVEALFLEKTNQDNDAMKIYAELKTDHPHYWLAYWYAANLLYRTQRYHECVVLLEQGISQFAHPDVPKKYKLTKGRWAESYRLLAESYYALNEEARAYESACKALHNNAQQNSARKIKEQCAQSVRQGRAHFFLFESKNKKRRRKMMEKIASCPETYFPTTGEIIMISVKGAYAKIKSAAQFNHETQWVIKPSFK